MKPVSNFVDKDNGIIFARVMYLEDIDIVGLNILPGREAARYLATDIMLKDGATLANYTAASHTPECKIFKICNSEEEAKANIVSHTRNAIIEFAKSSVCEILNSFNAMSREDIVLRLVGLHQTLHDNKYYFDEVFKS